MSDTMKRCPYCDGEVQASAAKCKHCSEWLDRKSPAQQSMDLAKLAMIVIAAIIVIGFYLLIKSSMRF